MTNPTQLIQQLVDALETGAIALRVRASDYQPKSMADALNKRTLQQDVKRAEAALDAARAHLERPTELAPSMAGEAYDDKCRMGMEPRRVMQRAHAMCPTDMPHVNRMEWMADYFMRNCKTAALLQSPALPDNAM
jgi:hypothetical protein